MKMADKNVNHVNIHSFGHDDKYIQQQQQQQIENVLGNGT